MHAIGSARRRRRCRAHHIEQDQIRKHALVNLTCVGGAFGKLDGRALVDEECLATGSEPRVHRRRQESLPWRSLRHCRARRPLASLNRRLRGGRVDKARATGTAAEPGVGAQDLTLPSSGPSKRRFVPFGPPLMSDVRRQLAKLHTSPSSFPSIERNQSVSIARTKTSLRPLVQGRLAFVQKAPSRNSTAASRPLLEMSLTSSQQGPGKLRPTRMRLCVAKRSTNICPPTTETRYFPSGEVVCAASSAWAGNEAEINTIVAPSSRVFHMVNFLQHDTRRGV